MSDRVEQQINRWAARRLVAMRERLAANEAKSGYVSMFRIPEEFEVDRVEFVHYDEVHYSELTWEPAYDQVNVHLADGGVFDILDYGEGVGDLVRDILAA